MLKNAKLEIKGLTKEKKTVHEAVCSLAKKLGHMVTTKEILAEAEKKTSSLHGYFLWDNSKAAHEYRLWQARMLIAEVNVHYTDREGNEASSRSFVSIFMENENGKKARSYVSVDKATSHKELEAQIRFRAVQELESWVERYKVWSSLESLSNDIKDAISKFTAKRIPRRMAALV
jgi:hypothetical protein